MGFFRRSTVQAEDPAREAANAVAGWGLHSAIYQHLENTGRTLHQYHGGDGSEPVGKLPWIGDTTINRSGGFADQMIKVGIAGLGIGAGALGLAKLMERPAMPPQPVVQQPAPNPLLQPFIIDGAIEIEAESENE